MRPTIAKINLTRLNNNISRIKQQIGPNTALMAIVKANGYGHGGIEIAKHSLVSGAVSLGVAIPQEGVELRSAGINCDILVLGGISRDEIDLSLEYDLSLCIYSIGTATLINQRARQKNKKVKIHIKIDTGMGRIGVRGSNEALNLCKALDDMDHLIVEGVFTHLACSDELDSDYSRG
ncbi:MAG TPA: alanine racemase, partial [Clostridia bacterium]|nr:alanine racemase [Clostridia bacterium]